MFVAKNEAQLIKASSGFIFILVAKVNVVTLNFTWTNLKQRQNNFRANCETLTILLVHCIFLLS